jgi:hypothetical protein
MEYLNTIRRKRGHVKQVSHAQLVVHMHMLQYTAMFLCLPQILPSMPTYCFSLPQMITVCRHVLFLPQILPSMPTYCFSLPQMITVCRHVLVSAANSAVHDDI